MKDEREVFDELIKNKNEFSHSEIEDIWDTFNEAKSGDIEAYIGQCFTDVLMGLDNKTLIEMMNKVFDANRDSGRLFLTVEEYCNWVIKECEEYKRGFTPYNLQEVIMNIHDNFYDNDKDIFDDSTFILQTNEYNGDYDPCNIVPADRRDINFILYEYLCNNGDNAMDITLSIALEYCDDDLMKLWYDCWDTIVPIYDKWQEKLEEMKEPEEED